MTTVLKFNQAGRNGFNNLFENLLKENIPAQHSATGVPLVNTMETADAFILNVQAPGRQKENFQINLDKKLLTISYQPKEQTPQEEVKNIRTEFSLNGFSRTFTVDDKINVENISAKYEDGILSVVLPKKEEVKITPKQITIQ